MGIAYYLGEVSDVLLSVVDEVKAEAGAKVEEAAAAVEAKATEIKEENF